MVNDQFWLTSWPLTVALNDTLCSVLAAKGANGNVASEDVVYMLQGMGIETGIDLEKLVATGRWLSTQIGRDNGSKVGKAAA